MRDFTIARNPIPIINQVVLTMIAGDAIFALSVGMIIFVRDSLQLDATLALLMWGIFFIKAFMVTFAVAKLLMNWLKTSYVVINNRLVMFETSGFQNEAKTSPDLASVASVNVHQTGAGRRFNFGTLTVKFDDSHFPEPFVLSDVTDPKELAKQLGLRMSGKKNG